MRLDQLLKPGITWFRLLDVLNLCEYYVLIIGLACDGYLLQRLEAKVSLSSCYKNL